MRVDVDAWIDGLLARHTRAMRRSEFLKAIRALSVRYVERRGALRERSPLDSAGKRAAFAGFFAPLHFLTTRAIVSSLGTAAPVTTIVDLGCGTGVAGAAWALAEPVAPAIRGIDLLAWTLVEARENWRALGVSGRAFRGDLVTQLERAPLITPAAADLSRTGLVLGWSVNELAADDRQRATARLIETGIRGARVLVIEPIATSLVPWWADFAERATAAGARAEEWRFDAPLPPTLADLSRDAGFDRRELTARSVAFNWSPVRN